MPRLLLFAPSLKTILDQRDNTFSLISLIDTVTAPLPAEGAMPANAALSLTWEITTLWQQLPEDSNKTFEQRTELLAPNGDSLVEVQAVFQMNYRTQRNFGLVPGLPVGQAGEHRLRLSLREANTGGAWITVAEFPILILHQRPQPVGQA